MQCPSCSKSQPMSFQCQFCGSEFIRRGGGAFSAPVAAGPAPRAAAAAVALDNPYEAPEGMLQAPVRVSCGEKALAGPVARLMAHFVDWLIALAVYLPVLLAAFLGSGDPESGFLGVAMMITGVAILVLVIYQLYLLSRDGQTLGKRAMKVRVVMYDDGSNPGFGRAVGLRLIVNGLVCIVPGYALVDVLFIFGAERRCLHDYIAGTKVVEA